MQPQESVFDVPQTPRSLEMQDTDGKVNGTLRIARLETGCSSVASTMTPFSLSDASDKASSHEGTEKASSHEGLSPRGGGQAANDNEAENAPVSPSTHSKPWRRSTVQRRRRFPQRDIPHIDTGASPELYVQDEAQSAREEAGRKVGTTPTGALARYHGSDVVTLADLGIHYDAPPSPAVAGGGTLPACPSSPCRPYGSYLGVVSTSPVSRHGVHAGCIEASARTPPSSPLSPHALVFTPSQVTPLTPSGQLAPGLPFSAHQGQVGQGAYPSLLQSIYTHGECLGPPSIQVSPCKAGAAGVPLSTLPVMEQCTIAADASARVEASARFTPERLGSAAFPAQFSAAPPPLGHSAWEAMEQAPQCHALTSWFSTVDRAELAATLKAAAPESYED